MKCVVCNSENFKGIQHKVFKCSDCNHTYIDYDGDGIHYHKVLYRSKGYDGTRGGTEIVDGKFTPHFHQKRDDICNKRVKAIATELAEANSILDIGAGGGTFLNKVKGMVELAEGTEVSDVCNSNLTNDGFKVYHGAFTQMTIEKQYDLVTCWHVLEHIHNLKGFPKKAYDVTNRHLIIEVPINRRLRNPDKNFDGHFHYFSKKSLEILFEEYFTLDYIKDGIQRPCLLAKFTKR